MKKANSRDGSTAAKGRGAAMTVDEYLARVAEPARSTLSKVRAAIRSAAPTGAIETISYGMPAFKHKGVLVWFAAFSNHCSLFPGAAVIEEFKSELKGFSTSKGTIQFPVDKPLSAALVKKMVKARIAQKENERLRQSGDFEISVGLEDRRLPLCCAAGLALPDELAAGAGDGFRGTFLFQRLTAHGTISLPHMQYLIHLSRMGLLTEQV